MADNVGYTPGTGATVAADEIGGVLHQRVKVGIGSDGTAVDISEANPMPVDVGPRAWLGLILARILSLMSSPPGYRQDTKRYQASAILESGTVTTVTTVTTASNLVNMNGLASDRLILNQNFSAWAAVHRSRIS
jgi:hypothetical protein